MTTRLHRSIADIGAGAWNALAGDSNPFVRYTFLSALETTGSLQASLGWKPRHVTMWRGEALVAAAPAYLKSNSHGEFVFDHAWADAHHRMGIAYFPKLLCAVPYSPVRGPRLLIAPGEPEATRTEFAAALRETAVETLGLSSVHVNFADDASAAALDGDAWLARYDVQFHWSNDGYASFDDFLGALTSKRRKEIRRERAAFASGWRFDWLDGNTISDEQLDFAYACYANTFEDKGNYPALTRELFGALRTTMPDALRVLIAYERDEPVAMAFCLLGGGTLYGRYWGSVRPVDGLHFECCYYRGIAYCIENGIVRFEPGAQGEHKLARGFLPVRTQSRHYIADPNLRTAIARSLQRESDWVTQYERSLAAHSPFAQNRG